MGTNIAITGLVLFVFFFGMAALSKMPPKQPKSMLFYGVIMLIGLFMIPSGLIIQVWM